MREIKKVKRISRPLSHENTWRKLERIWLSERNHSEKVMYHSISKL